jgi:hypothetical protein
VPFGTKLKSYAEFEEKVIGFPDVSAPLSRNASAAPHRMPDIVLRLTSERNSAA